MFQVIKRSSEEIRLMYVFEQAVEHIESKKKRVMGMNEPMDLKEAYERIEWQIKYDVDNYDKDPTVAGIIDLERIKEAIDELQAYKDKEEKLREYITSYESISTIQGLNDVILFDKNKGLDENTMVEMTNRYLEVHDKLLAILNEGDDLND